MEDILKEATWLAEHHVTELVVIAQDTTRYGEDLYGTSKLPELLRKLCHIPGIQWVRVLYCYPERITDELLDVLAEEPHMVPYLDLPIQHCDGEILKRMRRPGNEETLRNLIAHIRERVPNVTLRTTLITGFPGETKEQFNRLGDSVHDIMEQQTEVSAEKNAAKIGQRMTAVIEGYDKWAECYFGRTMADAPDIDGKIFIRSDRALKLGEYITVEVFDTMDFDLLAEEVPHESAE